MIEQGVNVQISDVSELCLQTLVSLAFQRTVLKLPKFSTCFDNLIVILAELQIGFQTYVDEHSTRVQVEDLFLGGDLDLHMVVFLFQETGAGNILANTEQSVTDEAKQRMTEQMDKNVFPDSSWSSWDSIVCGDLCDGAGQEN